MIVPCCCRVRLNDQNSSPPIKISGPQLISSTRIGDGWSSTAAVDTLCWRSRGSRALSGKGGGVLVKKVEVPGGVFCPSREPSARQVPAFLKLPNPLRPRVFNPSHYPP